MLGCCPIRPTRGSPPTPFAHLSLPAAHPFRYAALTLYPGASRVVLSIPPSPSYNVLTPETLGISLPASVLLSGQPVRRHPATRPESATRTDWLAPIARPRQVMLEQTIGVVATAGTATVSGTLAQRAEAPPPRSSQLCCNREGYLQSTGDQARMLISPCSPCSPH